MTPAPRQLDEVRCGKSSIMAEDHNLKNQATIRIVKRAILYGAGDLRLEEQPFESNALEPDQVCVQTEVTALSTGTDLGNYLGLSTDVPGAPGYPRPVGYSNVGTVRETGASVQNFKSGNRVFSTRPHQSAYIARQNELIVPVPKGVSAEVASLTYLAQLGLSALRQARYEAGENVAVVGLGVIGLCTIALARAMGANVIGIANSPSRSALARRVGAKAAFDAPRGPSQADLQEVFGASGPDIIVLTANAWAAYETSMEMVRPGGRISVVGFPGRGQPAPAFNPLDPKWLYRKQLTLLGSGISPRVECEPSELRFNLRRNLEYILGLMESGSLPLQEIISHRLPADRMKEAYDLARDHDKTLTAAVFYWSALPALP
jgi:threonine dehydrogenase-like Zn-dependent dehydrogenase